MIKNPFRAVVAVCLPGLLGATLLAQTPEPAAGTTVIQAAPRAARPLAHRQFRQPRDRLTDPRAVLGPGWRASHDRAVTVAGDATGLHVLALWPVPANLPFRHEGRCLGGNT